jgi:hypothetical protein
MVHSLILGLVLGGLSLVPLRVVSGASIAGVVKDTSGKPLENARIDHTGKTVVVSPSSFAVKPSTVVRQLATDAIHTDSQGQFRVLTDVPAIVIRKPGYESQRVLITGDARLEITLHRIRLTSRCKLSTQPTFKSKDANDSDYTAKWFYIEARNGPEGIISGRGPMYSWGAPNDDQVWTSVEYSEVMYENDVIDASGHSADGKYWRSRSIFGAAAQYYNQTRETAEQLDCVMDRVPLELR